MFDCEKMGNHFPFDNVCLFFLSLFLLSDDDIQICNLF